MSTSRYPPQPEYFKDWRKWAERFVAWTQGTAFNSTQIKTPTEPRPILLAHQLSSGNIGLERALTAGVLMYAPDDGIPVYSDGSQWVKLQSDLPVISQLQAGQASITGGSGTVTFPTAYAAAPIVVASIQLSATPLEDEAYTVLVRDVTTTDFVAETRKVTRGGYGSTTNVEYVDATVNWYAIPS